MAVIIGGQGVGGGTISTPITIGGGAGSGYTWASPNSKSNGTIKLEGSDADIFVQGKSMKAWMEGVEQRLCILEPKPELLKKYKALEQAYEHYKTLEAILYEQE
jgi:C-terminal processing protease CtpA/Prc